MRAARWLPLFVFGVAAACGGRTSATFSRSDVDDAQNAGGSSGKAKQSAPAASDETTGQGDAGRASSSSSSGGRAGVAGAPTLGVASAAGAGSCSCEPDIICEPGYVVSHDPARCCHCVVDCPSVGCLDLDCPAGSHAAQEDDECCPSCVPDQPLSCEEARARYDALWGALVAEHSSLGCTSDEDCGRFWEDNRCNSSCGEPIPLAARDAIEDELLAFAEQSCSNCPKQQPLECARRFPATCVNGACQ